MNLEQIITAAHGEIAVDLLIKNAQLVNVFCGEIHAADIAIHGNRIVGLGTYEAQKVIDLQGRFVCPGLIDAHVHLESSMVQPAEFARAVVPHGTTAVICDPHEIANVMGLAGVQYILDASKDLPLSVFVMAPSCVPATHMEASGAELSAADIETLLAQDRVVGLAEMMNFPGVLFRVPDVLDKLRAAGDRPIDGHAPGLSGLDLNAYVAAGVASDHECTELDEAREKLCRGMHIFIREGTTARNLHNLLPLVNATNSRFCHFCTDDRHPDTLLSEGHIDDIVRQAIGWGIDPVTAIQMATINSARFFGLRHRGAIAPGYHADLLVLDSLDSMQITQVYAHGELVAQDGEFLAARSDRSSMPIQPSIHLASGGSAGLDLRIVAGEGLARVIGVIPEQIVTTDLRISPTIDDGDVIADVSRDLLKIAVIERHHATGNIGVGLVKGVGLKAGAIASSVAHDSHNLVVIGTNDPDMRAAINAISAMGGGQVVVSNGEILAACPLPIAGLMSDQPLEDVREQVEALTQAAHDLGCLLPDPLMTMSFLALPVIPTLKISDQGLVDVGRFQLVPMFGE